MKKPVILAAFLFFIFAIGSLFVYLNIYEYQSIKENKDYLKKEYYAAIEHMKNKRYKETFMIIRKNSNLINDEIEEQRKWFSLLVDVSAELNEVKQLAQLFEYDPNLFLDHEKASLELAGYFLLTGKSQQFETLRQKWLGRESQEWAWINSDVEHLVLEGKRDEAIRLINSKAFFGKDEEQRLLLLSMLYAHENPEKSFNYLEEILKQNPKNISALSFRASLYEKMDDQDNAFQDHLMALIINPYHSIARSKLANYYFKKSEYSKAIDLYENSMDHLNLTDQLLLKLLFWNKLYKPIDFDWGAVPIPQTSLKPFLQYLTELKEGQFWNNVAFNLLPNQREFLQLQESYWLQLLAYLSNGNEFDAENLLNENLVQEQSWNKNLEIFLKTILDYRKNESLAYLAKNPLLIANNFDESQSNFIIRLHEFAKASEEDKNFTLPEEYRLLLKGPLAFPIVFISLGWNEAALQLQPSPLIPHSYPDWIAISYAEVIEKNRNANEALHFLSQQKARDDIEVAKLRLKMSLNLEPEENLLSSLHKYTQYPGKVGFEASKLTALIHLSNEHYKEAELVVTNNKILRRHPDGGEIIAKIALAEGDFQKANLIYSATENLSLEAQSFLARRAFSEKNWPKAKELTLNLLKKEPNNPVLQKNYLKILEFINGEN